MLMKCGCVYLSQMGSEKKCRSSGEMLPTEMSRRKMLAVSGFLAVSGLSGCLGRIASATTNTSAAPAAPFAGIGAYTGPSPTGDPTVYKLTPTVSSDSGLLSGDVELEAWVTGQAIAASCCLDYNSETNQNPRANYNNSRSDKSKTRGPVDSDSDADGLDDTVELRSKALELEKQLLSQTTEVASISKRSARTGRNPDTDKPIKEYFDEMMGTIDGVQATLERCSDDVCVTVRDHADGRLKLIQQAAKHVQNDEWELAADDVQEVQRIVEEDIALLESSLKDSGEPVSNVRLQELTGASDTDIGALYTYLADEPLISEQFTITVPDARLPGGDLTLVDELTPRRFIEYVTGRTGDDGHVYAWGDNRIAEKSGEDNSSPIYEGDAVGGESAIHRGSIMAGGDDEGSPLYKSDALQSYISGPIDTGIHLESRVAEGTITVRPVNDPPQTMERTPTIAVSADGNAAEPVDFDDWGAERGENATTSALVCPVMVAPPKCPSPFPALLYMRRCKHDDQYIYTGGWIIDDGFLYENSNTLVNVGGPTEVIGVDDGDGYGDVMAQRLSGDRERRGARLFDGTVSDAVAEGVLSESEGEDIILRKRPGRTKSQEEDDNDDDDTSHNEIVCKCNHLSAAIGHFTGSNASDNVKFKAGAELSKSVN
jgi:hypothetical protein